MEFIRLGTASTFVPKLGITHKCKTSSEETII